MQSSLLGRLDSICKMLKKGGRRLRINGIIIIDFQSKDFSTAAAVFPKLMRHSRRLLINWLLQLLIPGYLIVSVDSKDDICEKV